MKTVVVTQPYVPAYRVPLFNAISALLRQSDLELVVATAGPKGLQALRGDSRSGSWATALPHRAAQIGQRTIQWRRLPQGIGAPAALVTELEGTNLLAWEYSARKTPLVLWGHGRSYVTAPSRLGDSLEAALARRACRVMTYAPGGRRHLIESGRVDPSRVVAIGNSTDTRSLRRAYRDLRWAGLEQLASRLGDGPTAMFVGGLDGSKRIDFLLAAFREATRIHPEFRLIVAGDGALRSRVVRLAEGDRRILHVEDARGSDLARLAAFAHAIWMPGRVGLVAVDALALGLPIHSVESSFHAPEIEFLGPEELVWLPNEPSVFAAESLRRIEHLPRWPIRKIPVGGPSVEKVARAFVTTVIAAIGARS